MRKWPERSKHNTFFTVGNDMSTQFENKQNLAWLQHFGTYKDPGLGLATFVGLGHSSVTAGEEISIILQSFSNNSNNELQL